MYNVAPRAPMPMPMPSPQPQPYSSYHTTSQMQSTRHASFPGAYYYNTTRSSSNHSPSPLNPQHQYRGHSPSTALSEPIDSPDPAMAAEPYQDFEFLAGAGSHSGSSSASSSVRYMKTRTRTSRSGSGSRSTRSVPAPSPLSFAQKFGEYNPCAHGYHDPDKRKFGKFGIAATVIFFPLGILCLLVDTSRTCKRCGNILDQSLAG